MTYDKPYIQTTNPYRRDDDIYEISRTIFYGEVISVDDETEGGRIKVRISELDSKKNNENIPWAYPMLPKFFHLYPQVGEVVRVFIENTKYPEKSRFWIGSVISQLPKIGFDSIYTALSTTNVSLSTPAPAISTFPDANGVFPQKGDVAIIGRVNTDVILRNNEVHIRAGKHENDNVLKLNTKNPASINLVFEQSQVSDTYQSSTVIMSDKIALISHSGVPQFKTANVGAVDRNRIFTEGHPIARGDVLVEALNVIRNALVTHIHGYSNQPPDNTAIINDLEKIDFNNILQKNIVVN